MGKYEQGDIVTYYFVINKSDVGKQIRAYSDNKDLVDMYMQFHGCKSYSVKKVTDKIENIYKLLEDCYHDEIQIANLRSFNPKHPDKPKLVQIPATETEIRFIDEETVNFMSSRISYNRMNEYITLLKPKYVRALDDIGLLDVIKAVCYNKRTPRLENFQVDQCKILIRSIPDHFN